MTIQEARNEKMDLAYKINALVEKFEADTGLIVKSLYSWESKIGKPGRIEVTALLSDDEVQS